MQARSAYLNAEEAYQQQKYDDAASLLKTAKSNLGTTNTKIQYLLVKALKDAGKYSEAQAELKTFFDVTEEDNSDERYMEMVKNIVIFKEYARKEEDKIKEAQIKEQERIVTIEREKQESEIRRLKEQRAAEARQLEDQRLEFVNNTKMSVIGSWRSVSTLNSKCDLYDITISVDNSGTNNVSIKALTAIFKYQFTGTVSNCPLNSKKFCREIEGTLFVKNYLGGPAHSRPSDPSELTLPCKIYTILDGSKLVVEFQEFAFGKPKLSRDRLILKNNNIKLEFDRGID